jgi:choline-sulfatase
MLGLTRKQFLATGAAPAALPQARRPRNVLFLLSDQHRPSCCGHLGDSNARTPNIDSLARSGTRFDSAYCTNPVCTPSRASILTGLYTHNHRTWSNRTPWPFEIKTLAHHFSRAGYVSGLIGKMHFVDAQTHGFDYRLDFNDWYQYLGPKTKLYAEELGRANSGSGMPQIDDLWADFGDPWQGQRTLDGRKGLVHVGRASLIAERDHFESYVSRESVRFLNKFARNHPFFLVASYLKPHDPFMPPKRHAEMFAPSDMRLPDTYGKVDLSKVPREIRDRISSPAATAELADPAAARQRIAMYYGNIAFLDEQIGHVLRALRELGLDQDTVVVYSSDHGEMLGDHGLWQKFVFYEPSVGVPLIFRVPGVTREGAVCRNPVSQAALVATLLDLCGIAVPSGLDEPSLEPMLREPDRAVDRPVFSEFALQTKQAKYMIRRGDWKYCFYVNDMAELYNLRDDPGEMNNLALDPAHRSRAEDLKSQLFAWHRPAELRA